MKINLFLAALSFCFILSCKKKTPITVQLVKVNESISIPIDFITAPDTRSLQFLETDSGSYLAYLNQYRNQLLIIDLEKQKVIKRTNWISDGPDALPNVMGFQIRNKDTVFVTIQNRKAIFISNLEGEFVDKFGYQLSEPQESNVFFVRSHITTPIIEIDSKIFFSQFLPGNVDHTSSLKGIHNFVQIDLKTRETKFAPITYPDDLWNISKYNPVFSYQSRMGEMFLLYTHFDKIVKVSKDFSVSFHQVQSNDFSTFVPKPQFSSIIELEKFNCDTPSFTGLLYDKYRDVFYVVAYPGVETDNKTDIMKLTSYKPVFSIIILNNKLEKIGETKFPPNQYLIKNMFVGPKGLYVSENIPSNPDFDENFIKYSIFKL